MILHALKNMYPKASEKVLRAVMKDLEKCRGKNMICHYLTNEEKADSFPHWKVNGLRCHAKKTKGVQNGYTIIKERNL